MEGCRRARRAWRRGAGARGRGGRRVVGDDAVDADEDGVDERDEGVEAARDEGAAAQRLDVADAVEDVEQHRVVEAVEVVPALAARAPLHLLLLLPPLLHPLTHPRGRADRDPERRRRRGAG